MTTLYLSNRRRPAAYNVAERSNNRSFSNHLQGVGQDRYNTSPPDHHDQHAYRPEHRGTRAYDPAIHGQYVQHLSQAFARPTDSQYGPRMESFDFGNQQHYSNYSDDGEGSSTVAVVGSRISQPIFTPQQPYYDSHATPRTGDPYIQPARPQLQNWPPIDPSVPNGWTTRPAPGPYNAPSYQYGGQIQQPMAQGAPFMPNPGPMSTHYNTPQTWFNPVQSMHAPPPDLYAPASAFPTTNYSGVPIQPLGANVLYAAEIQPFPQPPVNIPPVDLPNNPIDQSQYPQANDNNTMNTTAVLPGATGPPRKNRRGKGKGKGRAEEA